MDSSTPEPPAKSNTDENDVRKLNLELLRAWNARNASVFASHFTEGGVIVGVDGTVIAGSAAIYTYMSALFAKHKTPAYVSLIRWVRFPREDFAIAHGIVGMPSVMTGAINPTLNAIQMLTCSRRDGVWRIELFQNTPAHLHGNPDEVARMTEELQQRLMNSGH